MTVPGLATTEIKNVHTHFVITRLIIPMRYNILTGIGRCIINTGICAIAKSPADPGWFAIIVMGWECAEIGEQWCSIGRWNPFEIC